MANYQNRQNSEINSDREKSQLQRRGEDVYGEGDDYNAEGYRNPGDRAFSQPYGRTLNRQQTTYRTPENEYEDYGNYGRGGYYGNTYDQENYNRSRNEQRTGLGEIHGRYEDADRDMYWRYEARQRPGYRSNEERVNAQMGTHRGKGPRGYQRSDERIRDDINDRLSDDPFIDASDIEVKVTSCEVTLMGSVDDREAKRRAEDISESVSGVKNVENRLKVRRNTDWTNRDGNSENRTQETKRSAVNQSAR